MFSPSPARLIKDINLYHIKFISPYFLYFKFKQLRLNKMVRIQHHNVICDINSVIALNFRSELLISLKRQLDFITMFSWYSTVEVWNCYAFKERNCQWRQRNVRHRIWVPRLYIFGSSMRYSGKCAVLNSTYVDFNPYNQPITSELWSFLYA